MMEDLLFIIALLLFALTPIIAIIIKIILILNCKRELNREVKEND